MPKQKNIDSVAKIKDRYDRAKSVVVTDYQGLTHKQLEELHHSLKSLGAEYTVVKNSLLKIATGEKLQNTGPTAVLFSYDNPLASLKELYKFIKTYSLPKVKTSFLDGQEYDEPATARLASLPSKENLIAQLMYTLNANTQKLAYILTQIKTQ